MHFGQAQRSTRRVTLFGKLIRQFGDRHDLFTFRDDNSLTEADVIYCIATN
jgi:hypothetical protein